jgi:lysophospholipase L1-like esterase
MTPDHLLGSLRGVAWSGDAQTPYPRADPADADRLPADTWRTAELPVGVRLELVGDARGLEIDYACATDDLGYRGEGAGVHFSAWRGEREVASAPARVDGERALLEFLDVGDAAGPAVSDDLLTVYLPEGMRPTIFDVRPVDGTLTGAPRRPRWLAYGDSLTEGWVASGPAFSWPMLAARWYGLDAVNLGYAGSARGELPSAEQIAALDADVISIAYGTNCWSRIAHSAPHFREGFRSFLRLVRQGHPETPIVVASPMLRPDAESTPNRLGATLADLRFEVEDLVQSLQQGGDGALTLVPGLPLLVADQLPDGIHPGDDGHRAMAKAIGGAVSGVLRGTVTPA